MKADMNPVTAEIDSLRRQNNRLRRACKDIKNLAHMAWTDTRNIKVIFQKIEETAHDALVDCKSE